MLKRKRQDMESECMECPTLPNEIWNYIKNFLPYEYRVFLERTCHDLYKEKEIHMGKIITHECSWELFLWALREGCPTDERVAKAAASGGNLDILKFLVKKSHINYEKCNPVVCNSAACRGHYDTYIWLKQNGFQSVKGTTELAAYGGNLELFKTTLDEKWEPNRMIWYIAAKSGHVEILKELVNRYTDTKYAINIFSIRNAVGTGAMEGGHISVIKWMMEIEWTRQFFHYDVDVLIRRGHFEALKLVHKEGYLVFENDYDYAHLCASVAFVGRFDILRWLRSQDPPCPWDDCTTSEAASGGYFDMMKWAHENGCPWDSSVCTGAAEGGYLEILQWAREHGCPWSTWTCAFAAGGGHLVIIQWAHSQGCPWDKHTCSYAAANGHLHVLQWARSQGCPWIKQECLNFATREKHPLMVNWIVSQD